MNFKLILIVMIFVGSIDAQLQQAEIDEKMSEAQSGRIYKQNRIALVLERFSKQIQDCSKALKAANVANNVVSSWRF